MKTFLIITCFLITLTQIDAESLFDDNASSNQSIEYSHKYAMTITIKCNNLERKDVHKVVEYFWNEYGDIYDVDFMIWQQITNLK